MLPECIMALQLWPQRLVPKVILFIPKKFVTRVDRVLRLLRTQSEGTFRLRRSVQRYNLILVRSGSPIARSQHRDDGVVQRLREDGRHSIANLPPDIRHAATELVEDREAL